MSFINTFATPWGTDEYYILSQAMGCTALQLHSIMPWSSVVLVWPISITVFLVIVVVEVPLEDFNYSLVN